MRRLGEVGRLILVGGALSPSGPGGGVNSDNTRLNK